MSNTEELKKYLIDEADGFLLNDDNNGKSIMLSGAWGAGKTHFWQEDILKGKQGLFEQLKDKACVYISLYGKDSLESIKKEVLIKASLNREKEDSLLSKEVSTFGFEALSSISNSDLKIGKAITAVKDLANWVKSNKGIDKLKDGGVICFDDFERKSKEIDLNDLFGFISQLAIEYQCKVIIILNSDVFEGEEANVFKSVKEKTINKYFYFESTRRELFEKIYDSYIKYKVLDEYKENIFDAINEVEELNARIYIQVLDNCFEWVNKEYDNSILRQLVLCTIFFIKHHYSLGFTSTSTEDIVYDIYDAFLENIELSQTIRRSFPQYVNGGAFDTKDIIHSLKTDITKKKTDNNDNEQAEIYYSSGYKLVEENKYMLQDFYHYKYILKVDNQINDNLFNEINKFIKTGILQKQTKEVESLLPREVIAKIKA